MCAGLPFEMFWAALWPAARGMAQTVNAVAPAILARILAAAADLQVRVCAGPKQVTSYKGESECERGRERRKGKWREREGGAAGVAACAAAPH